MSCFTTIVEADLFDTVVEHERAGTTIVEADACTTVILACLGVAGTNTIGPQGPEGPAGPAGPQGPAGADGDGQTNESYEFATPATSFTVNHTLGYYPGGILVTNLAGERIVGVTITQVSSSQINIAVTPATAIKVNLS